MGFWARLFGGNEDTISEEVKRARERHGIEVKEEQETVRGGRAADEPGSSNWEVETKYDPWEDLKDLRTSFWLGGWAAKRLRWRGSNDKLREELDALAKKREEQTQRQMAEAEARGDTKTIARLKKEAEKQAERERKAIDMVETHSDSGLRAELEAATRKREAKEREKAARKRAEGK